LAVKSDSGSASTNTARLILRNVSVVATSTSIRAGRSARAHTTPEPVDTSPDCMPCVICGRSGAKLKDGYAMPPVAGQAAVATVLRTTARRVNAVRFRIVMAIGPPPSKRGANLAFDSDEGSKFVRQHNDSVSAYSAFRLRGGSLGLTT